MELDKGMSLTGISIKPLVVVIEITLLSTTPNSALILSPRDKSITLLPDLFRRLLSNPFATNLLNLPPSYKGRRLKIYYANQTGVKPPKFTFFVNSKNLVHFSYERYLENKLRENFELEGTPIVLQFKNRNE